MQHSSTITTPTKMYVEVNNQNANENNTWLQ